MGALTADGTLLAAGTTHDPEASTSKLALARWTPAGKLDTTLGGTGKLGVAALVDPVGLMALPDGRFVVAGSAAGAQHTPALMRFKRDGSPDTSFGDRGVARLNVPGSDCSRIRRRSSSARLAVPVLAEADRRPTPSRPR